MADYLNNNTTSIINGLNKNVNKYTYEPTLKKITKSVVSQQLTTDELKNLAKGLSNDTVIDVNIDQCNQSD